MDYRRIELNCLERSNIRQELSTYDRNERSLSMNFYSQDDVPVKGNKASTQSK